MKDLNKEEIEEMMKEETVKYFELRIQNANAEIAKLKAENERLRKEYAQAGDKIADLEDRIYNLKIKFQTLNERDSE